MKTTAILLAAGQGSRMKSDLPKVLHRICGKPMLWYTLEAVRKATTEKPVVVIGKGAQQVKDFVGETAEYVLQEPQLGTAHAVLQAELLLKGKTDQVIVAYADMPLLRAETLQRLAEAQATNRGPISLLTVTAADPRGFGRILRNAKGTVEAIIEEYVATPEQLAIHELNAGVLLPGGVVVGGAASDRKESTEGRVLSDRRCRAGSQGRASGASGRP